MGTLVTTVKKWYLKEIWVLDYVKHGFLLVLRLYFGWGFMSAGLGKLFNVPAQTEIFRDWGIPYPMLNVYLAGTTETVCGLLLLLGAASRIITIPLIGTMIVAYLTAHTDQFYALFDSETRATFFKAPPFPYLFTCFIVLLFGPGALSIDGWIKSVVDRKHPGPGKAGADEGNAAPMSVSPPVPRSDDRTTLRSSRLGQE